VLLTTLVDNTYTHGQVGLYDFYPATSFSNFSVSGGMNQAPTVGGFRSDNSRLGPNDQHTLEGRKMGRGLEHFRREGARLMPSPTGDDPYEGEAYRLWQIKQ
jgi:hypothetical protein